MRNGDRQSPRHVTRFEDGLLNLVKDAKINAGQKIKHIGRVEQVRNLFNRTEVQDTGTSRLKFMSIMDSRCLKNRSQGLELLSVQGILNDSPGQSGKI